MSSTPPRVPCPERINRSVTSINYEEYKFYCTIDVSIFSQALLEQIESALNSLRFARISVSTAGYYMSFMENLVF